MKQLSRLIPIILLSLSAQSCSIVSVIYQNTDKKQTRIVMNDGSEIEGRTVMPKPGQKKVRVTTADGQKHKLISSDIDVMCLYKEKYPENQSFFQYMPYSIWRSKKKEWYEMSGRWMPVEAVGDHLTILTLGGEYQMSVKGVLTVVCRDGNIMYIARKAGDTSGKYVGTYFNKAKFCKTELTEYLSDDPVLCRMINDGDITDGDFQTIADEYEPEQKQ